MIRGNVSAEAQSCRQRRRVSGTLAATVAPAPAKRFHASLRLRFTATLFLEYCLHTRTPSSSAAGR